MIRVLQVVGKMNIGGTEQLLMNVFRNIDKTKYQFDFLTFYDNNEKGFFDDEIISLGGNIINIRKPSFGLFRRNVNDVKEVLSKEKYDAVHVHLGNNSAFSLVAAREMGVPIRITHSHNLNRVNNPILRLYYSALNIVANKSSNKCAACSTEAAKFRFTDQQIRNNYTYVPNSIDFSNYLKEYDKKRIRQELGITDDEMFVIQVGNLKPAKNQLFTIELINKYYKNDSSIKFVIVGREDSIYSSEVKEKIKEYDLENVLLLGQRTDIPELMSAANLMLMPSIMEGLGIVLIEAQAAGIPSVVSTIVPPEADMMVGLVKNCSLDSMKDWYDSIELFRNKPQKSIKDRIDYLEKSDFGIEKTVSCFEILYENERASK